MIFTGKSLDQVLEQLLVLQAFNEMKHSDSVNHLDSTGEGQTQPEIDLKAYTIHIDNPLLSKNW